MKKLLICAKIALFTTGCTDGFPFGPPPTLDSADWSLVDRDADALESIRLINLAPQSVKSFTFDKISISDNTMDLSVSSSGLLAVRSGGIFTILNLSDKSVLHSVRSEGGRWIAWSNSGDRLAVVEGFGNTLRILDAELNTLMSRDLSFVLGPILDYDFDISWSPDDTSVVVSTTLESTILPYGTVMREGAGLIMSSTDPDSADTELPYTTVYFLGDNLLVGTRFSTATPLNASESSVHIFSLTVTGIEESEAIPNAVAVTSSWPNSGTFLTYEKPPVWVGEYALSHSWHRIRDAQGRQSELLGDGPVRFSGHPVKLLPRDLAITP